MSRRRSDAGVTLLELTAVLAIFSVISLISMQLLSSGLSSRDVSQRTDRRVSDLASFSAVLRRDFEMSAPARADRGSQNAFRVSGDGQRIIFATAAARADIEGGTSALDEVIWRFDAAGGRVHRSTRPFGAASPPIETLVLEGVSEWRLRALSEAGTWVQATAWQGGAALDFPAALEVRAELRDLGVVRVVATR